MTEVSRSVLCKANQTVQRLIDGHSARNIKNRSASPDCSVPCRKPVRSRLNTASREVRPQRLAMLSQQRCQIAEENPACFQVDRNRLTDTVTIDMNHRASKRGTVLHQRSDIARFSRGPLQLKLARTKCSQVNAFPLFLIQRLGQLFLINFESVPASLRDPIGFIAGPQKLFEDFRRKTQRQSC